MAHFPPYLYHYLSEKEGRGIVLILNKCDLLPPEVVVAWEHYFHHAFPKLLVVPFSSFEGRRHPRGKLRMAANSSLRLVEACQKLVGDTSKYLGKHRDEMLSYKIFSLISFLFSSVTSFVVSSSLSQLHIMCRFIRYSWHPQLLKIL